MLYTERPLAGPVSARKEYTERAAGTEMRTIELEREPVAKIRKEVALRYHSEGRPGKIEVIATKPCATQRDLSLAYTPGVAEPCREIEKDAEAVYRYTARGNLVAVVSNGTAVLGLGNIGPEASKPVMEGKGVLFKRFADIDVFDIEIDAPDPADVIRFCEMLAPTVGGINLEDIKAPECFEIEETLKERLDIPVFHDDQHGTAIISGAALINALELVGKKIDEVKVVFSGAGASAIATANHYVRLGANREEPLVRGLEGRDQHEAGQSYPYQGQVRSGHGPGDPGRGLRRGRRAGGSERRRDVHAGDGQVDGGGPDRVRHGQPRSGDPARGCARRARRRDHGHRAIGLSEPGQQRARVPVHLPRRARRPRLQHQRRDVPGRHVRPGRAGQGRRARVRRGGVRGQAPALRAGVPDPDAVRPPGSDSEASAVAEAAMRTGVARKPVDIEEYKTQLEARLGPARELMRSIMDTAQQTPKRIVLPEGEQRPVVRASHAIVEERLGTPILLGDPDVIRAVAEREEVDLEGVEMLDPRKGDREATSTRGMLFERRKRKGITQDSAQRKHAGAAVLRRHDGGLGRRRHPDRRGQHELSELAATGPARDRHGAGREERGRPVHARVPEAAVFLRGHDGQHRPDAEDLAETAILTADFVRRLSINPRVAMISFSNFGSARHPESEKVRKAVEIVKDLRPDITIDGEMQADTAVVKDILKTRYPFSDLKRPANVLVFPNLTAANASYKLLTRLGGATAIGPVLLGMAKPVHLLQRGATVEDITNLAAISVVDAAHRGMKRRSGEASRPSRPV